MYGIAEPKTLFQHPWRLAALVGVVANVTYNFVYSRVGAAAPTVADVSHAYPTLFTPAGYAFAIWGLIYGASLVYAVLALMPKQLGVVMHDRVAPWMLLTNALASLWVSLFSQEQLGPSTLIIAATLVSAIVMYSMVSDHLVSEHLSHWWRVPFGLWLGWLSVATLANFNIAFSAAGWSGFPLSEPLWTSVLVAFAGLVAVAVGGLFLDPVVPFVIAWAAFAIAMANAQQSSWVAFVAIVVALKALLTGMRLSLFSTLPIPRAHRERIEAMLRFVPARTRA
ncbi:MAG: hypothetical protein EOO73_07320 [Myxococcales bacterium]|nr:MAG: hypothetical protein EOO73_07320 [Myxococcales bacterium]